MNGTAILARLYVAILVLFSERRLCWLSFNRTSGPVWLLMNWQYFILFGSGSQHCETHSTSSLCHIDFETSNFLCVLFVCFRNSYKESDGGSVTSDGRRWEKRPNSMRSIQLAKVQTRGEPFSCVGRLRPEHEEQTSESLFTYADRIRDDSAPARAVSAVRG